MFDIGMIEMFMIVILAIIVVGPKDLPKMLRTIGQFVSKIRKMGQEFQSSVKQMADEIELDDVTRKLNEAGNIPLQDNDIKPDIIPENTQPKKSTKDTGAQNTGQDKP